MSSLLPLARQLEQLAGLGIFVVGVALFGLSVAAWRRERDPKLAIVSVAYGLFALHGLAVLAEYYLVAWNVLSFEWAELLEHASAFLILAGLLAFFAALSRE
ncbi:hypothetical protein ACKVMT_08555 [Halobacteriales archaeon Cl-PHB]